ncbi:hypothetical protein KFL_001710030 [Klebsormidium nitens]|uniref:Uncharacterized protein n=1 Tax=Klebsormidium nitens TaxID=105231 RepID=A0A1Y1I0J3_KLENI|nr:hypothetical protein KFL_001710030 [Klebsormidium nitens]|eukprot:GAQ83973.1 hypothetical protein KFL_001710030 [Klebsormidium nitens]
MTPFWNELHRWSARPGFFDDVVRHVSTARSPLTLFDSGGVAEPEPEAVKGQGRRLVGLLRRGIRELSSEGTDWQKSGGKRVGATLCSSARYSRSSPKFPVRGASPNQRRWLEKSLAPLRGSEAEPTRTGATNQPTNPPLEKMWGQR